MNQKKIENKHKKVGNKKYIILKPNCNSEDQNNKKSY